MTSQNLPFCGKKVPNARVLFQVIGRRCSTSKSACSYRSRPVENVLLVPWSSAGAPLFALVRFRTGMTSQVETIREVPHANAKLAEASPAAHAHAPAFSSAPNKRRPEGWRTFVPSFDIYPPLSFVFLVVPLLAELFATSTSVIGPNVIPGIRVEQHSTPRTFCAFTRNQLSF